MKKFIVFIAVLISFAASAQDTLIKKNGDILKVKITEIGTDEVKFKIFGNTDGPTIVLKNSEIKTAIVAGQKIIDVKEETQNGNEDLIVKKDGTTLKIKVMDIGTEEVKFKLVNDPDGPTISVKKADIKTMVVKGQKVIDVKVGLSEDIINRKDGSVIKAKISEMGTDIVKYKLYNNPDGPVMTMRKFEISSITMDGQVVYEYKEDPLTVTNHAILDKTSVIKFNFFSPLNHHLEFGYEWMNRPGFNYEVALGIIGPGVTPTDTKSPKGAYLRGGPKFLFGSSSDVETGDGDMKVRYAHPLKGRYIKVEAILNAFSSSNTITNAYYNNYPYTTNGSTTITYKNTYQSFTLDLQYGRQYIMGNALTASWYIGAGYSFENKTTDLPYAYQNNINYLVDLARYSHSYLGKSLPMAWTAGFTVGFILPAPKWMINKKTFKTPPRHYKEGAQVKTKD